MALVFVGGSFYTCAAASGTDKSSNAAVAQGQDVVAVVDGVPVTAQEIQAAVDRQVQQSGQPGDLPPEYAALFTAGALTQAIQQAAVLSMAQKANITVSDDEIRKKVDEQFNTMIDGFRKQMEGMKKLKPGASAAELDKLVKSQTGGQGVEDLRKKQSEQLDKALKEQPDQVKAAFLQQAYLDQQVKANPPSDDELKASYNTYTVKQILLKGGDADKQAETVETALKGGLKFEDAMNRYSKDLPLPNKKVADNSLTVTGAMMDQDQYKTLKGLKVGEVSAPAKSFEGTVIYKIVSVKQDLPKDFDANKAKYAKDFATQKVSQDLQAKAAAIAKGEGVVWKNDLYKTLMTLNGQPGEDPKAHQAALRAAADVAKAAGAKATGNDAKLAAQIRYAVVSQLLNAPDADKATLRKEQIEVINEMLKAQENPALRMNLVNLLAEDKSPEAGNALLEAVRYNNDTTEKGQSQYAAMAAKLRDLKTANLITPETATQVQTELSRWLKDKADYEKAQAATRASQPNAGGMTPPPGSTPPPPTTGKK
ncbi:hypothetical protein BH11ARM2_BH11ARM2_05960 [soil metagenome]